MMRRSTIILWLVTALVLGWINMGIVQKEQLIANGEPIFLELAPVDPRSLIQGDYMILRYAVTEPLETTELNVPRRGALVVQRDGRGIASYVRIHDNKQPLASDELLVQFHYQDGRAFIGAESFFFQEGFADVYQNAEYAELRVDTDGESVLIGLRDADLVPLQPPVE